MSNTRTSHLINRRIFGARVIVGAAAGPGLLVACGGGGSESTEAAAESRVSALAVPRAALDGTVKKWQPNDLVFTSTNAPADAITTRLAAKFTGPGGAVITVPGFFSEANTWTVRFSATREGTWTYETTSSDAQLNGKTGSLTCVANTDANARGFIQIDPSSPYHFVWENGDRHFKLGYELDWLGQMPQDGTAANRAAVDQLLDMLVANGFTDVLLSSYTDITPSSWKGQSSPLTGGPYDFGPTKQMPWLGTKSSPQFDTVNPAYWRNFDYAVEALFKRGLIAHLYIRAQSNKYVGGGGPYDGTDAQEAAYARYVVARYQAYPNVIFDYQKEAPSVSQSEQLKRLDVIESADGYSLRLRTAHDGDQITDKVTALPRYDFRTDQFHGGNPYAEVLRQRDNLKPGGWPVYNAERDYQRPNSGTGNFSNGSSPAGMIDGALEHVMAGGYYAYYYEMHAWDLVKYDEVPAELSTFGNLARFMATTKWYQLTPNDSIIGGGSEGKHALANAGKEYVVQVGRSHSTIVLSVSGVAASSTLSGRWLNLKTGETSPVSNVGNGNASFSKPWSGVPAMLHLSASGSSPPANQAPIVNAGSDASTPNLFYDLQGKVEDSTVPAGQALSSSWSTVSGPGAVSFGDVAAAVTRATFSAAGAYVLELKATDGELSATDTVRIEVGTTSPPTGGGDGLKGEYFANKTLTGTPVLTRTDATVDFNWGSGSPAAAVPSDNFSVRWTGFITAPVSGAYTLYVNSNDGNRLWVGGTALTNRWNDGVSEQSATITLVAGQRYAITLEVYEGVKTALAQLSWAYPGQAKQVIPKVSLSSQ